MYRVTDEALIAETAVWPNICLMNVFFALKGSKLFIIISTLHCFNHFDTIWCVHKMARHYSLLKICFGSRKTLPVTFLEPEFDPKKTNTRKRSNEPPDIY